MKNLWLHVVMIVILLIIPVISSPDFDGTLGIFQSGRVQRDFIRFILAIAFFYLNIYYLLPKLVETKKYFIYGSIVLLVYIATVFIPYWIVPVTQKDFVRNGHENIMFPQPPFQRTPINQNAVFHSERLLPPPNSRQSSISPVMDEPLQTKLFMSIFPFMFSFLSSLYLYRTFQQREMEKAKAKAELLNLKYQLQPHFLFNTLNSIYSLSLMKSEETPNAVLKLSNVMRYVVQESLQDEVELSKELEYLKDYIDLQLMRTSDSLDFSYTETGNTEDFKIAPLILVNFVENAFKYGFNSEQKSKISVSINITGNTLNFNVGNSIVNPEKDRYSLQTGLKNTLERLNKIYPKNHTVSLKNDNKWYEVNLEIQLT